MDKLEKVVEIMQQKLGEDYKVFIRKTVKNNSVELAGVAIERPGDNIAPLFYVADEEIDVCGAKTVAEHIVAQYKTNKSIERFDTNHLLTREYLLNNVEPKAIGYEANKVSLKAMPHRRVADIAGIYIVVVSEEDEGITSYTVTHEIMEKLHLDMQELDTAAKRNYFKKRQIQLLDVLQTMQELRTGMVSEANVGEVEISRENMYTLRDSRKINGASVILYDEILQKVADKADGNLIILPSSIHEVMIIKEEAGIDIDYVKKMVKDINNTAVDPQEVLTNSVYKYTKENKKLEIL